MAKKKEVEVIDMGGAKTVAKKKSFITRVNVIFAIFSIIWLALAVWFPLHVRDKYATSIKQSTVVAIFYDLQRNVADQYEKMLLGIKKSINLEKPIGQVIDKVKMAEGAVNKVTDTTARATEATNKAKDTTSGVKTLSGIAGKFGINTSGVDKAVDKVDSTIGKADKAIAKVDDTAALVNQKLTSVENELTKVAKTEVDKVIDDAIKAVIILLHHILDPTHLTAKGSWVRAEFVSHLILDEREYVTRHHSGFPLPVLHGAIGDSQILRKLHTVHSRRLPKLDKPFPDASSLCVHCLISHRRYAVRMSSHSVPLFDWLSFSFFCHKLPPNVSESYSFQTPIQTVQSPVPLRPA